MNKGDTGKDVGVLQTTLVYLKYSISDEETRKQFFGGSTELAVKQFQQSNNLVGDGIVGPNTNNVLTMEISKTAFVSTVTAAIAGPIPVVSVENYIKLLEVCKVPDDKSSAWGPYLHAAMLSKKIVFNRNEVCSFTANVLHETGLLSTFEENLNYSSTALRSLFPTHFTVDQAEKYGRTANHPADQRMVANLAYGGRMGNGPPETNDGWNRKGRGPFQLTGSFNYAAFYKDSGIDVLSNPNKLTEPETGSISAAWFWVTNNCGPAAQRLDHEAVCKKINGGTNGLAQRKELTQFLLAKI